MDYSTYFTKSTTEKISIDLLGRPLIFDNGQQILGGYIVETEAYLGKRDRAAHSYQGRRTAANEGLYRRGGTIYIYAQRQYFFFDIATQKAGEPQGILIRAIEPAWGIKQMITNRSGKSGPLLTNGPAKMMQAFGIHNKDWNLHFLSKSPFTIDLNDNHKNYARKIIASPRIGINQSSPTWASKPLRYYVSGNPYVSRMKIKDYQPNNGWKLLS